MVPRVYAGRTCARPVPRAVVLVQRRSALRLAIHGRHRSAGIDCDIGQPLDRLARPLHDLRISVTDRCNFRCTYCMPKEIFGRDYAFLPKDQVLSFEEIHRAASAFVQLGVEKLRITGASRSSVAGCPSSSGCWRRCVHPMVASSTSR